MSGFFSGKEQKSTNRPPEEVMKAFTQLMGRGQNVADLPLQQYGGPRNAGFTPDQTAAFRNIESAQGMALPYINSAANMTAAGSGNAAEGIGRYMNPYENDVVQATLADINHQNSIDQNMLTGNAISRGAWGGDRGYLAKAQLAADQGRNTNSTLANMRSQGWNTALGASQADLARLLQGGNQMAGLGAAAQNSTLQGADALMRSGTMQQGLAQSQLDHDYQQFQERQEYPYKSTQFLASLLGGIAPNMGSTQTTPGPSAFSQIAGLGLSAASLFSDRRIKEDIKRVGHTDDGLPVYTYKYKGDPTTRMGVMAQDVEKKKPGAVSEYDGIKAVNYEKLARGGGLGNYDAGGGVIDLIEGPDGIFAPQVDAGAFAVHNEPTAGGGLGAWFNPMEPYRSNAAPIVTNLPSNVKIGSQAPAPSRSGYDELIAHMPFFGAGPWQTMAVGGGLDDFEDADAYNFDEQPEPLGLGAAAPPMLPAPNAAPAEAKVGFWDNPDKMDMMLHAGLGMMASNSPFALQAIGEGAQAGLGAYRKTKQEEALRQYKSQQAEAAMKRAEAQAKYYQRKTETEGDKSWVNSDGETVQIVHKSADGKTEVVDTGIKTSQWRNADAAQRRLALDAASKAETARHNRVIESKITPGPMTPTAAAQYDWDAP